MIANGSVFMHTLIYVMNQSAVQQQESAYSYYYTDIDKAMNASKCFGSYGCFELSPPWISEHRPIALYPEDLSKIEPNYLYYSRVNPTEAVHIDLDDFDFVLSNNIDALLPTYTIAHGFLEGGGQTWVRLVRLPCEIEREFPD
uniref:Uncharacterized protein n=2 Tax=Photinus pyralis TaxID=7054 RepID=A0A1Y1LYZ9_PHOPY